MAVWLSGGVMTCLAVACPLLKESYVDGSLSVIPSVQLLLPELCFQSGEYLKHQTLN